MTEDNSTKNYNEFVRVNLPSGMTYNGEVDRYQINNHSFFKFKQADWYYKYIIKYGFSPEESFSPSILFAGGEVGVWYDPSPETTFTDTAGTTPATVGSAVALMLDKSKGLVLGPEQVADPTLTDQTGWTPSGDWVSVTGGFEKTATTQNSNLSYAMPAAVVVGKTYEIELTVDIAAGSSLFVYFGTSNGNGLVVFSGTGTFRRLLTVVSALGSLTLLQLRLLSAQTGSVSNVSVKELPGNHATQSVTAARPILARVPARGRANLLTRTEEFDNAVWNKVRSSVTPNASAAPDGTVTADRHTTTSLEFDGAVTQAYPFVASQVYTLTVYAKAGDRDWIFLRDRSTGSARDTFFNVSTGVVGAQNGAHVAAIGDVGDGWFRCSITFTATVSATNTIEVYNSVDNAITSSIAEGFTYLWGAQLELGSTASAYQKVTSTYDVTEAGQADNYFLWFDGIDDSMVTPTITPGIDKVQVFAGVRKLSDDAVGEVLDYAYQAGGGNFFLRNGSTTNPGAVWSFASKGTVAAGSSVTNTVLGFASPITSVLSLIGEISTDTNIVRANGSVAGTKTNDQGTGNYLAYPMYIGSRAGTSLRFNGQLYSLITRFGANLDANVITQTETYVAGKTAGVEL